ncbi:hypothetical protein BPORC_1762 [Bifidobacterium porcinum]|nr:hypothetical protein BPORC_1762 [Bifidobacterium porcinum]
MAYTVYSGWVDDWARGWGVGFRRVVRLVGCMAGRFRWFGESDGLVSACGVTLRSHGGLIGLVWRGIGPVSDRCATLRSPLARRCRSYLGRESGRLLAFLVLSIGGTCD